MIAVGYMDPGNWATNLEGGSRFGYKLLSVVLISNILAMLLQHLSVKLGIVTGTDLAQACKSYYSPSVSRFLWITAEIAIAATDLAEVIGTAIALQMLFKLPLMMGVLITVTDVLLVLMFLDQKHFRVLELLVGSIIVCIFGCFAVELSLTDPAWGAVAASLLPSPDIVTNPEILLVAAGILGATVMPHSLYLHSALVQTRDFPRSDEGRTMAIKMATIDSNISLLFAFFINAAILILSAATFGSSSTEPVADITVAYELISPALGTKMAGLLFALSLLGSGFNSSITGTLAGAVVMEGFVSLRLAPWLRRLLTRAVAIVPAAVVAGTMGDRGINQLLILSQVVLSMQLVFAVYPLVSITNDVLVMGPRFVNSLSLRVVAWIVTGFICVLNVALIVLMIVE